MRHTRHLLHYTLFALLLTLFCLPSSSLARQDITSNWANNDSRNDGSDTNYSLTYSFDLEQEITETMSLQESFRSTNNWQEEDNQSLDPSVRFNINNDLFLFELYGAGSKQRYSDSSNQKRSNIEAVWSSTWNKRFWPNLRTSYGVDWQEDDESPNLTDTQNTSELLNVDWNLELFKVYYNYKKDDYSDYVSEGENIQTNHFARIEASHQFLANRLNLGFSHQYSETTEENSINLDETGTALVRQTLSQVLHGLDADPADPMVTLTPVTALHDGDLLTATSVATDGIDSPPHNLALKVDFKIIDMIYLYTSDDQLSNSSSFAFDLYSSSDGSNWQLETTNLSFTYDSLEQRFELPLNSLNKLWLKVVITASPLSTVTFSEIEAYQYVTVSQLTTTSSSSITDINVGVLITDTITASYNVSIEDGEYGSGIDYERNNHTGSLQWQPMPNFTTTLGLNQTTNQNSDAEENIKRSYTLNMDTSPLNTVDLNMGLTRSEEYIDGTRQSVNHTVGLLTTAALYPDLDSSLDLNYGYNTEDLTNETTRNYTTILILTAHLTPDLTSDLTTNHKQILGGDGSQTTSTILNINWRTSEKMSIHLTGQKEWLDFESSTEGADLTLTLAPTITSQFSLRYTYQNTSGSDRINKYVFFGSFALGPHITLQNNAGYSKSQDQEEWQVQTQLIARFSIL